MISFITDLMRTSLEFPEVLDLCVENAHRSLTIKPKDSAPPRWIIIRFADYTIKDAILKPRLNLAAYLVGLGEMEQDRQS